ncbi:hypothetical protein ACFW0H_24725 [Pseudomonas sp. CR3202]
MHILKHLLLPLLLILSMVGFDHPRPSDSGYRSGALVLPVIWLDE